jgi:hypothetical protein
MKIIEMKENQTNLELLILNFASACLHLVPYVQLIAGLFTIVVVTRNIAKGIREDGGFVNYMKSFRIWK